MKTQILGTVALSAILGTAGTAMAQSGLTLDFSSLVGAPIDFGGSSHSLNFEGASGVSDIPGGAQWVISTESGSAATVSATGLRGAFDNGPFTYGSITTSGLLQTASITGPLGGLTIEDGSGGMLTGNLDLIDVSTFGKVVGFINANVQLNLTDVIYTGSNPDLRFLTANQPGSVDLSFQFNPGKTLTDLSNGSMGQFTSYSGSISAAAVPEPASFGMSALSGLGALVLTLRARKS